MKSTSFAKSFFKKIVLSVLISLGSIGLFLWVITRQPDIGGDFSLIHRGQAWRLSQKSKSLNILYIGYAKCPDVCPLSLSHTADAFHKLSPEELKKVQFLFLSVDFKNDTAEFVDNYALQFFENFVGLTGTKEQIDKTVRLFGANYRVEENTKSYLGYSISHVDKIFFLNRRGIVLDSITSPRSGDIVLKKIKELL